VEKKTPTSSLDLIDEFQALKEQIMKLQMFKEQILKDIRRIQKSRSIGVANDTTPSSHVDGLEMKYLQEQLEMERKEKETLQTELLPLKSRVSDLGSLEEMEELRKQNAELTQANQKLRKKNTALRVSLLEMKLQSKQNTSKQAPQDGEFEKELAQKTHELEEERKCKEEALAQLENMVKVIKVMKTKLEAEVQAKKMVESKLAIAKEKSNHTDAAADIIKNKEEGGGRGELEAERVKWAEEKAEMENRLAEALENERASASAVLSLNQQVVKLEAVLSQHRKEREEISLSKKNEVEQLEKEKQELQEQLGQALKELKTGSTSNKEAEFRKLREEVGRLQREKQLACQLLVSANDRLNNLKQSH